MEQSSREWAEMVFEAEFAYSWAGRLNPELSVTTPNTPDEHEHSVFLHTLD